MRLYFQLCLTGKCSTSEAADSRLNTCAFGNSPVSNCSGINIDPSLCYLPSIRYDCCGSCENVSLPKKGKNSRYIENTMLVSFDIRGIRRDQKHCRNGEACRATPMCFWSSLINLILKDNNVVFYLSCFIRRF